MRGGRLVATPAGMRSTTALCSRALTLLSAFSVAFAPFAAHANPQGGTVSAGQASITANGKTLDITQSTDKAVIDWRSFNIGADELTAFHQPSSTSMTLNRVNDINPSQILGQLTANGHVVLVNPNGVFFGPNSKVDVSGLVATTANISNSDFMAGNLAFTQPGNPSAAIINQGTITAKEAGLVGFVAPHVENDGLITAKLGKVTLASGDTFALDMAGDKLITVAVSGALTQQIASNTGQIVADGGTVMLTAAAARQVVDEVVSNSGAIQANSIGGQNGHIELYAEGSNAVEGNVAAEKGQKQGSSTALNSGTLSASGQSSGETGGTVEVLADNVGILSGSVINASGDAGGGAVRIGGDFHGAGTTPTAMDTVVQTDSVVTANAITSGKGGNVTVWADDFTSFSGNIEAKGGATAGDGGFVETSGHQTLSMQGNVDASARNGTAGTWLLDPNNLIVNGNATTNAGSSPNWTAGAGGGNVLNTNINTALNGGTSVNLTASGSIEVAANISKSAGSDASLTLAAGTGIAVDSNVGISSTSGKLNVTLDSNTAGSGGAITMANGSSITSNGGNILMGGGADPTMGYAATNGNAGIQIGNNVTLNSGAGSINTNSYGIALGSNDLIESTTGAITLNAPNNPTEFNYNPQSGTLITSVTGAITLSGSELMSGGNNCIGVELGTGTISSTGSGAGVGAITINGTAYASSTGAFNFGVDGGAHISSADGDINLTGITSTTVNGTGSFNIGINFSGTVTSTGNGNVTINGQGANTGSNDWGFLVNGATITAHNGSINAQGTGAGPGTGNSGIHIGGGSFLSTGTASITLTGTSVGNGFDINFAGAHTLGGASDSGAITLNADSLGLGVLPTIQTSGNVTFAPRSAATTVGVAGDAGTLAITSALLGNVTAGSVTIGRNDGSGLLSQGAYNWAESVTLLNGNGGITIDGAQSMGSNRFLAQTSGSGNVALASGGSVTSSANGNAITIVTGNNFVNSAGSAVFTTPSGRWLIYSGNESNDTLGGLTSSFHRYSCSFSGSCPSFPGSGNGLLYSYTPILTATPSTPTAITYGDAAPNLANLGYASLSGYLGSDSSSDSITGALNGATPYVQGNNAGNYSVTSSGTLASAMGYGFSYGTLGGGLTVNRKSLAVTADNASKTYGSVMPALTYHYSGLVNGDNSSVFSGSLATTATASSNAGTYAINQGSVTAGGNYAINYSAGTFLITPAALSLAVRADDKSKTYGSLNPLLTFSYSGMVNGDTGNIFSGSLATTAALWSNTGSYPIIQGTLSAGANYNLTFTPGTLTVNPLPLSVTSAFSETATAIPSDPVKRSFAEFITIDPRLSAQLKSPILIQSTD